MQLGIEATQCSIMSMQKVHNFIGCSGSDCGDADDDDGGSGGDGDDDNVGGGTVAAVDGDAPDVDVDDGGNDGGDDGDSGDSEDDNDDDWWPYLVPLVFHNLSSYDGHFVLQFFCKEYTEYTTRMGAKAYADVGVIPLTGKRNMQLKIGNITFMDSCQFLTTSRQPRESLAKVGHRHRQTTSRRAAIRTST